MHILLSRTDSIGDVMLTLPMAGLIKKSYPEAKITFLGKAYTKPVIHCCKHVDEFIDWDSIRLNHPVTLIKKLNPDYFIHVFPRKEIAWLAKKAGIVNRVGASGRIYHYFTCNRLIRFSRRRSNFHESQLNLKLLDPLNISSDISLYDLSEFSGFTNIPELPNTYKALIDKNKINVILHPKSKGSAVEWGLNNFSNLIKQLPEERFKIFITGTEEEAKIIGNNLPFDQNNVSSLLGKLSLNELIAFIHNADCLVAASTGPLHMAGLMNKVAIGLFSSRRPIHPGRWAPLGKNSHALVSDDNCAQCAEGRPCDCITNIPIEQVVHLLQKPSAL